MEYAGMAGKPLRFLERLGRTYTAALQYDGTSRCQSVAAVASTRLALHELKCDYLLMIIKYLDPFPNLQF